MGRGEGVGWGLPYRDTEVGIEGGVGVALHRSPRRGETLEEEIASGEVGGDGGGSLT